MTDRKRTKDELLETLRGEIFAAEIKVALDKELGRETSPIVKKLAAVKLPAGTAYRPEEVEPAGVRSKNCTRYRSAIGGRYVTKSTSAGSSSLSQKSRDQADQGSGPRSS